MNKKQFKKLYKHCREVDDLTRSIQKDLQRLDGHQGWLITFIYDHYIESQTGKTIDELHHDGDKFFSALNGESLDKFHKLLKKYKSKGSLK